MASKTQDININISFSSDANAPSLKEALQNFRLGIFNALLQQDVPPDQQEKEVNKLVEQGYLK